MSTRALQSRHLIVAGSLLLGLVSAVGQIAGFFGRISIVTAVASLIIAVLILVFFPAQISDKKLDNSKHRGRLTVRQLCLLLAIAVAGLGAGPFATKYGIAARGYEVGNDYVDLDQHARARIYLARSAKYFEDLGARRKSLGAKISWVQSEAALGNIEGANELIKEVEQSIALTPDLQARLNIVRGVLAFQRGEYEQAMQHYQAAHQTAGRQTRTQASLLNNEGVLFAQRGDIRRARENYEAARVILEKANDPFGLIHLSINEASLYYDDLPRAISLYEAALSRAKELDNQIAVGTIELNLGRLLRRRGSFDSAQEHFDRARLSFERSADIMAQAEVAISEAQLESARGRITAAQQKTNEATALLLNVHRARQPLVNIRKAAQLSVQLASIYDDLGDSEASEKHYTSALESYARAPDAVAEAAARIDYAALLLRLNRYSDAKQHLIHAREVLKDNKRQRNLMATLHNNLGMASQNLGDLPSARAEFATAMSIFDSLGYRLEAAEALENIAVVDGMLGRPDSVTDRLERSIRTYEELEHFDHQVRTLFNLFASNYAANKVVAQGYLERVLAVMKGNQVSHDTESSVLFSLYPEDVGAGNIVSYRERVRHLHRFYQDNKEPVGLGRALTRLARIELFLGNTDAAISLATQAQPYVDAIPLTLRINVHIDLGGVLADAGDRSRALSNLWQAFDLLGGTTDELRLTVLNNIGEILSRLPAAERGPHLQKLRTIARSQDQELNAIAKQLLATLH